MPMQTSQTLRYLAAYLVLALSALAQGQSSGGFFKETFEQMLRDNPEFSTMTGHHEFDDRWTDWSKAARDQRRRFFEQRLGQVDAAVTGDSAEDVLTKRLIRYDFQVRLEAWELDTHLLRVGQLYGFHNVV